MEKPVDKDTTGENMVYSDCGTRSMFTIFECVVIAAIVVFFLYITVAMVSHCRTFYQKGREEVEMVRQQKQKTL